VRRREGEAQMSRGYDATQRAILDLIASNPHGAWTTLALATAIYGDASKPCHNAVLRALRAMKLPGSWAEYGWRRRGYPSSHTPGVLCDPHDAISLARSHGVEPGHPDQADRLALYAKEAAFNRMTPLERLDRLRRVPRPPRPNDVRWRTVVRVLRAPA
jgi:hypothetical protein